MPATVANTKAPSDHLSSSGSREDMAALRSSGGKVAAGTASCLEPPAPGAGFGPEKAPKSRALQVCGRSPPSGEVHVMSDSGYRRRRIPHNRPPPAGGQPGAGYGCGPDNPPGRLAQLVRAQPSHG